MWRGGWSEAFKNTIFSSSSSSSYYDSTFTYFKMLDFVEDSSYKPIVVVFSLEL